VNTKPVYFVADLHLAGHRPSSIDAFVRFLSETAPSGSALYILGDLFEFWVGDDDRSDSSNEVVLMSIAKLAQSGVPVYFMPGNRDFVLGSVAAKRAHLIMLEDPTVVTFFGRPTLLAHGDAYCTGDGAYQTYRRRIRSKWTRTVYDLLPLGLRRSIVQSIRRKSELGKKSKSVVIMDVEPSAIETALRTANCDQMIHGHTHRPARHDHLVDGRPCVRWVLADWYANGSYLRLDPTGITPIPILNAPALAPSLPSGH
jgi:UDP-2,3-diacylglucosamine hydrolase